MTNSPSPPSPRDWAVGLRARRHAARLERATLAELTGLSSRTIQAIELGNRNPSLQTMELLDAALAGMPTNPHLVERLERLEETVAGLAQGAA